MFTQLNQYHVIEEVDPSISADDRRPHAPLRALADSRPARPAQHAREGRERRLADLDQSSGSLFPSVTLSFNLAPGMSLGDAVTAIHEAEAAVGKPDVIGGTFQGTAQAFQASLQSEPWLILAALVAVYIVLGILYESAIHPLTIISTLPSAGVGALLALMLCGQDLSIMGHDRHDPPDRHREEERDHDDRLRARSRSASTGYRRSRPSARPACCASARS